MTQIILCQATEVASTQAKPACAGSQPLMKSHPSDFKLHTSNERPFTSAKPSVSNTSPVV